MRRSLGRGVAVGCAIALAVGLALTLPGLGRGGGAWAWSLPGGPLAPPAALPGSIPVAPAYAPAPGVVDLGPVGAGTAVEVVVGLASQDPDGLAAFVGAASVPGTAAYRQFLSAPEAAARFGASPGAVASAEAYFASFGLDATAHPDGLLLSVSGSAPAVARAFGTTLDTYRSPSGETFLDHPTAARLPAGLPWTGVLGLSTAAAFLPAATSLDVAPAALAGATGCAAYDGELTPCELAAAYDFGPLEANGTNGTGERIAVVDPYSAGEPQAQLAADFKQFSGAFGLPTGGLSFFYPVPTTADLNATGTNAGWGEEEALDVEWAHAAAPGAQVEMVFSPNNGTGLYFAIDWVVAERAADVLSMSWGEPEVGVFNAWAAPCHSACNATSDGSIAILDPVLELGAAEGISSFAASGDCGSADGTSGVAVSYPASDPYVTGVGATNLTIASDGAYRSETAWSGNGSGTHSPGCVNQGGSGGGFSTLPRPWWQTGEGTVASLGRGVPDVAMAGGPKSPVEVVVGGAGVPVAGTSVATPIWAGIAATADQAAGGPLGPLDPALYAVLRSSEYATAFHAITNGSNGYGAHAGWNPVTGIGTPVVAELVPDLVASPVGVSTLSTDVFASPRFGAAPLTVRFTTTVSGGTGVYALEGVAFGDGTAAPLVAGNASHTFDAPGVYSVQAYAVDSSGNTSSSPPVVVVVGGGGPLSVSLNATALKPAVGANVTFFANVTSPGGPFLYNFSFGDGSFVENGSSPSVVHAYAYAGGYCAEAVVRTTGEPPSGAATVRLPIAVGGAASPSCGVPSEPLTIVPNASERERDAPADFPSLFTVQGGSTAPGDLQPQVALSSNDPYTVACGCTILRSPGNYTFREWENDTVDGEATATANVTVAPALNATFTASTLGGPVPLSITFTSTVHGGYLANASATRWEFGNGHDASGVSVRATYSNPGEYVAIASLSDNGFGNASEAFVVDAEPPSAVTVGVTATVSPAVNVSSGETVRWSASEVGPPAALRGTVLLWDLGNGGSAFGASVNETYFAPVDRLSANDLAAAVTVETSGQFSLVYVPVVLDGFFAREAGGFAPAVDALLLAGNVSPDQGVAPMTVTGAATASGPGGVTVGWTFGDGTGASGAAVAHLYGGRGTFTVSVLAQDAFHDAAVRLETVVVNGTSGSGLPLSALVVVLGSGVGAGLVLAVLFVWATRPREPRASVPGATRVGPPG